MLLDNRKKLHPTLSIIIILGCLLLAGTGFIFFRLRNGVLIKAPQDKNILPGTEIICYRQDDEQWSDDRLGDSQYTLRSSGCLVSCIASALSMENNTAETPGTLNMKLSSGHAYDAEGNLQWGQLSVLYDYQVDVYQEVSSNIIDNCLLEGRYPIVRVRMHALGSFHYVLIVGIQNGKYLCMDPLRNEVTSLSSYGNRVYGIRCVSQDG